MQARTQQAAQGQDADRTGACQAQGGPDEHPVSYEWQLLQERQLLHERERQLLHERELLYERELEYERQLLQARQLLQEPPYSAPAPDGDAMLSATSAATYSAVSQWNQLDGLNGPDPMNEQHPAPLLASIAPSQRIELDELEDSVAWRPPQRRTWHVLGPVLACALLAGGGVLLHIAGDAEQQARVERSVREIELAQGQTTPAAAIAAPPPSVARPDAEAPRSETLAAFTRLNAATQPTEPVRPQAVRPARARADLSGMRTLPWVRTKYEVRTDSQYASRPATDPAATPPRSALEPATPRSALERVDAPRSATNRDGAPNQSDDPLFGL